MRTIEQTVVSWGAALTLLATTVSTPASEQPYRLGSQAARQGPNASTIGTATAAQARLAAWPGEEEYLSFVWSDARDLKKLPAAEGHEARTCRISARGAAEFVADRQLRLAGGGFLVDSASSAAFCDRCRRSGILDVELVLIPDEKQLAETAVVMGAFRRNGAADLLLYQRADTLWLDVARAQAAVAESPACLGRIEAEKFCVLFSDLQHHNPGRKTLAVDGTEFGRRLSEMVRIARANKVERLGRGELGLMDNWLNLVCGVKLSATPWYDDPRVEQLIADPETLLRH